MTQIPAGWEETTLGERAEAMFSWGTPSTSREEYYSWEIPWVRTQEVNFNYINKTEVNITELGLKNSSAKWIKKNTVIIAMYWNSAWRVAYSNIDATTNQACCNFFGNKSCDNKFVFFNLMNRYKEILWMANWAAQQNLSVTVLKQLPIHLPPLPEQQVIAAVLSSFDDKIELLRAENQTLEQMGQELFKERFGKSPNIKVWMLGDWVDVKRGSSPRPIQDYISEKGYKWLKISDASAVDSPFIFDIKECIREEGLNKTILLKSGTLVLSNSATPGIPKILAVDSCIHDGWLHFPKSRFSNEFLYLLFKEIRPKLIQQGSGSVFTNLKTDILKKYEIPIPDQETLSKFDLVIKPLFNKIRANSEQIQTLSATRDQLLPKLMSGEVRVEF